MSRVDWSSSTIRMSGAVSERCTRARSRSNSLGLMGLERCSAAPSANPISLSPSTVTRMTGISQSSASVLSNRKIVQPSKSGLITSRMMASGFSSPRQPQTVRAACSGNHSVALLCQRPTEHVRGLAFIVHHQHRADDGPFPRRLWNRESGIGVDLWDSDRKGRALAGFASTVTSPPSMRQKCRVIASPSPVPP